MSIRVAIIGLGYWGPNLLRNFYQNEKSEVIICCDKDESRLRLVKWQYPVIHTTTNPDEIFNNESIQAVIIATPSDTHATIAQQALESGKHVLVEKPLTLNAKEAQKLIRVAGRNKKILMVGHTYIYHPAILKIKELIKQGVLGRIYYIYGSRLNLGKVREETNALWNLAPHDIAILRFLLENNPIAVSAFGQNYLQSKQEDVVFLSLRYPDNIIAHIHVSWLDPSKERKITLIGSEKMVIFDDLDNEANLRIYDKGYIRLGSENGVRGYREFSLKLRPGDIHLPYVKSVEPLRLECQHFIDCIVNNHSPQSDGKDGLEVVKVLEAAQRSLKKKGIWIKLS